MRLDFAPDAWKLLHGVFAVYKPEGVSMTRLREAIIGNLINGLNSMRVRPPHKRRVLKKNEDDPKILEVIDDIDWSDHPLVIGPRYLNSDVNLGWPHAFGTSTTGVCVLALNKGCGVLPILGKSKLLNIFRVKGRLGLATHNFTLTGRLIEKSRFSHVNRGKLDCSIASIQSAHQRQMLLHSGFDVQSEEAYEMAASGLLRPFEKTVPIIYGMKCIDFKSPYFIVEFQCINTPCAYLKQVIHEIGIHVKSNAAVAHLQCIRQGYFTVEDTLLRKHWNVEHIIDAMIKLRHLVDDTKLQHHPQLINLPEKDQLTDYQESDTSKSLPKKLKHRPSFLEFVDNKIIPTST